MPKADAAVALATDGRVPGRRGQATRQRLVDCANALLITTPYRELTVTDITRDAGTSPATFYQYFDDLGAIVLAVAEELADEGRRLAEHIDGNSWKGASAVATAEGIVDAFLEFWITHRPVLRVVELLTEEGDNRFRHARARMLNVATRSLAAAIQEQSKESNPEQATAMAGALVAMLTQVASHQRGFEAWDIHMTDVREAMVKLIYWGVTNPKVPKR